MTDSHRASIALTAVLIAFTLLGILYSVAVPIFEKPDEPFHFFFIEYLLRERQLPNMREAKENRWEQEGSQPPLYYLLAAVIISPVDLSDAADLYWINPQRNMGNPGRPGNKNFIVHTDLESWPFQSTALAVYLARWLSLVFGATSVWLIYAIAREIIPGKPWTAVWVAAVTAFIPQFLFISSSASNDSLITCLAATTLLQLIRLTKEPLDDSKRSLVLLGITLGLAALSKLTGLALWGLTALVLTWRAWTQKSWRSFVTNGLMVGGLAAAIAGWWYIRNLQLYGDISALDIMVNTLGNPRDHFVLSFESVRTELVGLRASFWGLFGWFGILMPDWIYISLDVVTLLGTIGGIVWFLRDRTKARWLLALLLLWLLAISVSLTSWTLTIASSQGRLLFPALSGIMLALVIGLNQLAPPQFHNWLPGTMAAALLLLSIVVPFWLITPAYAKPPLLTQDELPSDLDRLDIEFGNQIHLFGCQFEREIVRPEEALPVTCYWQAMKLIPEAFFGYHHLLGRNLEPVGKEHGYHGSGSFPTNLWPTDKVIASTEWVTLDQDASAPTLGRLAVGVFLPDDEVHLTASDSQGNPVELVIAGKIKFAPAEAQDVDIPNPVHYSFSDIVTLSGYQVNQTEPHAITLYWEPLATPAEDYTVFVHLIDENANLVGQGDGPPVNGDYPSSYWEAGEVIVDEHAINLESGVEWSDQYSLAVGLYRPADGTRLPVWDAEGVPQPDDRIILPLQP